MGRQYFIDRWVDNMSYQYFSKIPIDPEKVNFIAYAFWRRRIRQFPPYGAFQE
jgi:hypothetical protein